ncbi:MAG: hypothetical protein KC731_04560 [Myxococcales bacterium]|nr:hypothetical protein [Myxococcales bacterium]
MLINHTPFSTLAYCTTDLLSQREGLVVLARGVFRIGGDARLRPASRSLVLSGSELVFRASHEGFSPNPSRPLVALRETGRGERLFLGRADAIDLDRGTESEVFVYEMPRLLVAVALVEADGHRYGREATIAQVHLDPYRELVFIVWRADLSPATGTAAGEVLPTIEVLLSEASEQVPFSQRVSPLALAV